MRRKPMPEPQMLLPAYETLPDTLRRVIRDELVPVQEALEELRAQLEQRERELTELAP